MHLFEGFIALFQATRNAQYLARAGEIFGLFSSRFFQPDHGWLCEYLAENLVPLPDQWGRISEPGHHYEWIWLLRQFERSSGRSVASYCSALYDHADRYGWDKAGFIVDEVECTGAVLKESRRFWPHTEGLKANIAEGEAGRQGCDSKAAQCVSRLMGIYIYGATEIGRLDRPRQRCRTADDGNYPGKHSLSCILRNCRSGTRDIDRCGRAHLRQPIDVIG